jgi:hypothetical protein
MVDVGVYTWSGSSYIRDTLLLSKNDVKEAKVTSRFSNMLKGNGYVIYRCP